MRPITRAVIFPKGLDEVSHSISVIVILLDARATRSALLVIG